MTTDTRPVSKFEQEVASFDVTRFPLALEETYLATREPQRRAIMLNFLQHATLEIAGRWEEILVPELTVEHPVYRMSVKGQTMVLDGMDQVREFYEQTAATGTNIMGSIAEDFYISDTGVASEALWGWVVPGAALTVDDVPDLDTDAHYLSVSRHMYLFKYDNDARLLGEYVYDSPDSYTYRKLEPSEVTTPEQAARALAPILERIEGYVATERRQDGRADAERG